MSDSTSPDSAMVRSRTVTFPDGVDHKKVDVMLRQMLHHQAASDEPINLLINSDGGNADAALRLCDFIEHVLTVPVHGWVMGRCYSSATYPLLYCTKRRCTPFSTFLIHSITVTVKSCRIDELRQLLADAEKGQAELVQIYQERLQLSPEKMQGLIARGDGAFDNKLSALEAKELGLVEEIISGKIPLFDT